MRVLTGLNKGAFLGCSGIESLVVTAGNEKYRSADNCIIETETKQLIVGCKTSIIPSDGSVTSIGYRAFYGCSGLTSVTIPDSVTSIGYEAFRDCSGLTNVTIGNRVTSIGYGAFLGCSGIESLVVTAGNEKYRSADNCIIETETKQLIVGCKTSIIPSDGSVTSIGYEAFRDCSGLTSVTIPDSVTSIGQEAFYGCSGLTSVTIGNSVTSIGDEAFRGCSELTSVKFENPNGWFASKSSSATYGTNISSIYLSEPSTAARYLKNTYSDYYWKRK